MLSKWDEDAVEFGSMMIGTAVLIGSIIPAVEVSVWFILITPIYLVIGAVYAFFITAHYPKEKRLAWCYALSWVYVLPVLTLTMLHNRYTNYVQEKVRKKTKKKDLDSQIEDWDETINRLKNPKYHLS